LALVALTLAAGLVALIALRLSLVLLAFATLRSLIPLRRLPCGLILLTVAALHLVFLALPVLSTLARAHLSVLSSAACLRAGALCARALRAAWFTSTARHILRRRQRNAGQQHGGAD
jgi:hypothetical protein